jgi:hypothetical protein
MPTMETSQSSRLSAIWKFSNGTDGHEKSNSKRSNGGGRGGNFGRGGGNHRNNHEVPTCAYISALAAIMGLYVLSHIDDDAEEAVLSLETTWAGLLQLVRDGKVEHIVVTDNNTVARIYVVDESINIEGDEKEADESESQHDMNGFTTMVFGDTNSEEKISKANTIAMGASNFHHDGIEAPSRDASHHSNLAPRKVYRLSINASFEEKLEDAQRKCGRSRQDFVSVQYQPDNMTDESPVLTAAARIALIGLVTGMVRIVTKRPGGGFGGSAELSSSLGGVIANGRIGASIGELRRMKALGVAMVPLLTRLPRSWTKTQPSNSWRSVFTYPRK